MAIMHMQFKILKRSEGKSSVYLSAYNNRLRALDERTGQVWNYTKKEDLYCSEVLLPTNAPRHLGDSVTLWNEVEKQKRRDVQLSRYFIVALPVELDAQQNRQLLKNYLKKNFVNSGMIADYAIHDIDSKNPHAHVMLTMQEVTNAGLGKKVREWNNPALVEMWRRKWAFEVNKTFRDLKINNSISHLSFLRQKEILINEAKKELENKNYDRARTLAISADFIDSKKPKKRISRKIYKQQEKENNNKKHERKEIKKEEEQKNKFDKFKNMINILLNKFNHKNTISKLEKEIEIKKKNISKLKKLEVITEAQKLEQEIEFKRKEEENEKALKALKKETKEKTKLNKKKEIKNDKTEKRRNRIEFNM
ncbi:MobA/MobL family protein [Proteus mirabilis]|uniref:MobQ family relaxase n=1 Tax=Proteus mirabilis TaxID=584 RepID=UPI001FAD4229|nr:MobQ family relaxase [Proteus mirabilis]MCI9740976.1 MobA/MobL family protein [Proteus mirabilis]